MRRSEHEILDEDTILAIINHCDTIRIGMWDGTRPYILPVNFGVMCSAQKIIFYIHGARTGNKFELLQKYPDVCVEGDQNYGYVSCGKCGYTCRYESFIAYGKAALCTQEEALQGIQCLLNHCDIQDEDCCDDKMLEHTAVWKITISTITAKRNHR